jgi:hypothetical protein
VSGWRKCDTCRKVRQVEEFDGASPTCQGCLTAPAPRKRAAAPVTRTRTAPAPAPAPAAAVEGRRAPLLGTVGAGDLEVRERRAKRAAYEALAETYPEDYAFLLRQARAAEGLRPSAGD